MGAFINLSNIKNIYCNGSKIKTVCLGDTVVYQSNAVIADDSIDPTYNYFVFDVRASYSVDLADTRRGDATEWDGLTDWDDGTVDNLLTHTYEKSGTYTVKTKWTVGDSSKSSLVGCENINRNMTDVSEMFRDCSNLVSVDFTNLNPDITNLSSMFYNCTNLTNVNNINTSNIVSMSYMFYKCRNIDGSQFINWDVSKVEDMSGMFQYAKITNCLDLSSWDVSNVIYMSYMFNQCLARDYINISNWKLRTDTITVMGVSFFAPKVLNMFVYTYCSSSCWDVEHHVIHNGVSSSNWNKMKAGQY